jgi:hypothetical protein
MISCFSIAYPLSHLSCHPRMTGREFGTRTMTYPLSPHYRPVCLGRRKGSQYTVHIISFPPISCVPYTSNVLCKTMFSWLPTVTSLWTVVNARRHSRRSDPPQQGNPSSDDNRSVKKNPPFKSRRIKPGAGQPYSNRSLVLVTLVPVSTSKTVLGKDPRQSVAGCCPRHVLPKSNVPSVILADCCFNPSSVTERENHHNFQPLPVILGYLPAPLRAMIEVLKFV